MNGLFIFGYGAYLLAVVIAGNGAELRKQFGTDLPGYVPWIFAIVVLGAFWQWEKTRPAVGPFIFLFVVALVLRKNGNIQTQLTTIYNHYVNAQPWSK